MNSAPKQPCTIHSLHIRMPRRLSPLPYKMSFHCVHICLILLLAVCLWCPIILAQAPAGVTPPLTSHSSIDASSSSPPPNHVQNVSQSVPESIITSPPSTVNLAQNLEPSSSQKSSSECNSLQPVSCHDIQPFPPMNIKSLFTFLLFFFVIYVFYCF